MMEREATGANVASLHPSFPNSFFGGGGLQWIAPAHRCVAVI